MELEDQREREREWDAWEEDWIQNRRCPVCGREAPEYAVETVGHQPIGCEGCLMIRREGVIQL